MGKQNTWNLWGIILGIAIVILGVFLCMDTADFNYPSTVESASFGGDFYTYQYSATREAANNLVDIAQNIRELTRILSLYAGWAFIVTGSLTFLHYGKLYFCNTETPIASQLPDKPEGETADE